MVDVPITPLEGGSCRWMTDRAVSIEELRLVPKHAVPAGRLAPLWAALGGRLRVLELQLERDLPAASDQVWH